MLEQGASSISITDIDVERGRAVAARLKQKFPAADINFYAVTPDDQALLYNTLERSDIVVNTTGVGKKDPSESPLSDNLHAAMKKGTIAVDLNYRPEPVNAFLRKSSERGAAIYNGTGLLIAVNAIAVARAITKEEGDFNRVYNQASGIIKDYILRERGLSSGELSGHSGIGTAMRSSL
jgi:shikimate 5-dehydrogenase